MNLNMISYIIYLPIISFIMIKVGWLFYKNGEVFLLNLFKNNIPLAKSINILLLSGYYLTNIGCAIITIAFWDSIDDIQELINALSLTLGKIILGLAILHYNNILWLKQLQKTSILK